MVWNPPAGAPGVKVGIATNVGISLTRTAGVLNSLMISVAVLRGVGVVVRDGIGVMVGVFEAVGLAVGVRVGAGVGSRSAVEQASERDNVHRRNKSLRIAASQGKVAFIIPPV